MADQPAIDLRQERTAIEKVILAAVKRFAAKQQHPKAAAHHPAVTGVDLFYDVGNGYLMVNIDVRSPHEPDGSYSHEGFAQSPQEHWREVAEAICDDSARVVLTDGSEVTLEGEEGCEQFDQLMGQMLVDLLKQLRDAKGFSELKTAARCELGVEADDGTFGWPRYEDRGKDNLV